MKYLLSFLIILSLMGSNYKAVEAQEASIALSPPLSRVAIQPGRTAIITYTIENKGDPAFIALKVRPFSPKDTSGSVILEEHNKGPIQFSYQLEGQNKAVEEAFFMKSREQKKVRVLLEAPRETPDKDYYYALLAELQAPPEIEGVTSVRIKATTVSYMLITVTESGQVDSAAKILKFSASSPGKRGSSEKNGVVFDSNAKIDLTMLVANTGKNVIHPRGTIDVRGILGGHASYDIPTQTILAGSQRKFSLTLPQFFMGNYKIAANLSLGEGAPVVFAQTSFIVFPYKIAGFFVIILGGIFLVRMKRGPRNSDHNKPS